ncbi:MAG TPA: hypothetical protein VJ527_10365 [Rhodanobacter sp.]|nr:hypothetical protein [Rhodanobacter sp.]
MKATQLPLLLALLAAGTGAAVASSGSLNEFRPKVLPVLVQVNAQGKVTTASPAMELPPSLVRLMRANLDEMISKPATDRKGRPIASQFIINLTLLTTPNANGNYDAKFSYVSTSPVPAGSWYWVHIDGHRLALASQDSFNRGMRLRYDHRDMNRNWNGPNYRAAPMPAMQNTIRNAPGAAPARTPATGH